MMYNYDILSYEDEAIQKSITEGLALLKKHPALYGLTKAHFERRKKIRGLNPLYLEWIKITRKTPYADFITLWESGELVDKISSGINLSQFLQTQPYVMIYRRKNNLYEQ